MLKPQTAKNTGIANADTTESSFWNEDQLGELNPYRPEKTFVKLNYIHQNPVRAGIVAEAEHYLHSSAIDYSGRKGLIDIDFLR